MIRYQFTSDWYHFYFHQIYTDFTANNKIKEFITHLVWRSVQRKPVFQIFSEIVAHKWSHRHRVVHDLLPSMLSSSCGLWLDAGANHNSMFPTERFKNQWYTCSRNHTKSISITKSLWLILQNNVAPDKALSFLPKTVDILFLFLHENICCGTH